MKLEGVIFDFDGVISNSVGVKGDCFREIYKSYGPEVVKKVYNHHMDHGGMSRYEKFRFYHKNFLGLDLTEDELNKICNKFSSLVLGRVKRSDYIVGAHEFLVNNKSKYRYYISTGTPSFEINEILKYKNIDHYFDLVFGSPENKIKHIEQILLTTGYNVNELIFIGDSIVDKNAADHYGIKFIGVCNPHNISLIETCQFQIKNMHYLEAEIMNMRF